MNTSTLNISDTTLGAIVDQFDDNDMLGITESDDGIDVLVSKSNTSASVVTDEQDDITIPAAPAAVVAPEATVSKASLARAIFNREYPRVLRGETRRCDVIKLFISEAGLTDKGAGTYYQNFTVQFKKAAELAAGAATTEVVDNEAEAGDNTDSAE